MPKGSRRFAVVSTAVAVSLTAAASRAQTPPGFKGVTLNSTATASGNTAWMLQSGKPERVQVTMVWEYWEPTLQTTCAAPAIAFQGHCFTPAGQADPAGPESMDDVVRAYTNAGVKITAIVYGLPGWAAASSQCSKTNAVSGDRRWCAPAVPADFARFARFLAWHYNGTHGVGTVNTFVIENEVNSAFWYDVGCAGAHQTFAACGCTDAQHCAPPQSWWDPWLTSYASVYKASYDGIKAEQAQAEVLIPVTQYYGQSVFDAPAMSFLEGTTSYTINYPHMPVREYLSLLVPKITDTPRDWRLAVHPYNKPGATTFGPEDFPWLTMGDIGGVVGWLKNQFPGSAAAGRVHITEFGYNATPGDSTGETRQANQVCDSLRNALGTPGIVTYGYNALLDEGGFIGGLRGPDPAHVQKAAWVTWASANAATQSCGFELSQYTQLRRAYSSSRATHWQSTRVPAPAGFVDEGPFARLLRDPPVGGGTVTLYECRVQTPFHNVLSTDSGCPMGRTMGPIGQAYTTQVAGTIPLRACHSGADQFVGTGTIAQACGQFSYDSLLGYVYPP